MGMDQPEIREVPLGDTIEGEVGGLDPQAGKLQDAIALTELNPAHYDSPPSSTSSGSLVTPMQVQPTAGPSGVKRPRAELMSDTSSSSSAGEVNQQVLQK